MKQSEIVLDVGDEIIEVHIGEGFGIPGPEPFSFNVPHTIWGTELFEEEIGRFRVPSNKRLVIDRIEFISKGDEIQTSDTGIGIVEAHYVEGYSWDIIPPGLIAIAGLGESEEGLRRGELGEDCVLGITNEYSINGDFQEVVACIRIQGHFEKNVEGVE